MTYKELKEALNELSEEELELDVSVYANQIDETYKIIYTDRACEHKATALEYGHPILVIE